MAIYQHVKIVYHNITINNMVIILHITNTIYSDNAPKLPNIAVSESVFHKYNHAKSEMISPGPFERESIFCHVYCSSGNCVATPVSLVSCINYMIL